MDFDGEDLVIQVRLDRSPPWPVQRLALAPFAPFARLRGLRPAYRWGPLVSPTTERPEAAQA